MSPDATVRIRRKLAEFDLHGLLAEARTVGRASLSESRRESCARLWEDIDVFRGRNSHMPRGVATVLNLAERFLRCERFIYQNDNLPHYFAYANIPVVEWYVNVGRRRPHADIYAACQRAIGILSDDLLSFELMTYAGLATSYQEHVAVDQIRIRLQKLWEFCQDALGSIPSELTIRAGTRADLGFAEYYDQPALALRHLTLMPRTLEHDEVLFIRIIQISECVFWAIAVSVLTAIEEGKAGAYGKAARAVDDAAAMAAMLTPLFQTVKTMPPEHFRYFRDLTGDASAIQSRGYQLLEKVTRGVDPPKEVVLTELSDDLGNLGIYTHERFLSLHAVWERCVASEGANAIASFGASIDALDRELLKWRTLHRQIALTYLSDIPTGTGGTTGVPYLDLSLEKKIRTETEKHAKERKTTPRPARKAPTG